MKMVPHEITELKKVYKYTKNQRFLEEFLDSGLECVRIEEYPHTTASNLRNSLDRSIKRFGYASIKVLMRRGEVFLVRTEL